MNSTKLATTLLAATAAAALALGFSCPTLAADLPSRKAAPAPVAPQTSPWTGFYAGIDAGYAWSTDPATVLAAGQGLTQTGVQAWTAYPYLTPGVAALNSSGFIGGGHLGFNYEPISNVIVGVEAEGGGLLGGQNNSYTFVSPGGLATSVAQIGRAWDWAGAGKGRVGYLVTKNLLVYGLGGFGFAHANIGGESYGSALAATYQPGVGGRVYTGAVYGGGLEFMFAPGWSARVEFERFDLGTHTVSFPGFVYGTNPAATIVPQQFLASVPLRANVVKAGVSWHFGSAINDPITVANSIGIPQPTGNLSADGKALQNWFQSQASNWNLPVAVK